MREGDDDDKRTMRDPKQARNPPMARLDGTNWHLFTRQHAQLWAVTIGECCSDKGEGSIGACHDSQQ